MSRFSLLLAAACLPLFSPAQSIDVPPEERQLRRTAIVLHDADRFLGRIAFF